MKKLIFILALLLMAAPAWSQVTIDVNATDTWNIEDDPNLSMAYLQFKYEADLEDELVRAFALEISVTGPNAVIDWIWSENDAYLVAPGGEDGIIAVFGEDGEPWIIEQASLYSVEAEDGIQPDPNGLLFGIEVIGDAGTEICVDVELNAIRGGIVMEDATAPDGAITADPCCVTLAEKVDEGPECGNLTEAQLAVWVDTWAEVPQNWCNPCWRCGDEDDSSTVTITDVGNIFGFVFDSINDGKGDWNMGGTETITDVGDIFTLAFTGGPAGVPLVCADDPNCLP